MDIELRTVTIGEVVDGFVNDDEEGVLGFGGKLNIRPKYQREFVYDYKKKTAVIDTIFKNFPLNVMYWVENEDSTFELLDGQQRTISFCSFYMGEFTTIVNDRLAGYANLTQEEKTAFQNYKLQVYICKNGTDKERLDWFKIINIAGERLTDQELRNAIYTGEWLTALKRKFSKSTCLAKKIAEKLMFGSPIRQEYLQTVLGWIADRDGFCGSEAIEHYMSRHQHDSTCDREWQYFQSVVNWVRQIFPKERNQMKGLPWGLYYNKYSNNYYSSSELEQKVKKLMLDDDVTYKKGIYEYLLNGDERKLNIRAFSDTMKSEAYEYQQGFCQICHKHFLLEEMEADHIKPWSKGGKTSAENCQLLCRDCNRRKSNK